MKVVIVAFKVSEENSVYYTKVDFNDPDDSESKQAEWLGERLLKAAQKGADFVSVRFQR